MAPCECTKKNSIIPADCRGFLTEATLTQYTGDALTLIALKECLTRQAALEQRIKELEGQLTKR